MIESVYQTYDQLISDCYVTLLQGIFSNCVVIFVFDVVVSLRMCTIMRSANDMLLFVAGEDNPKLSR